MEEDKNEVLKKILEWCLCTIIALIMAILTRYYIVTPTLVKQTSMYPTLRAEERLLISRVTRITNGKYERGDIITFESPSETNYINLSGSTAAYNNEPEGLIDKFLYYVIELNKISFIKRVIAIEGDYVEIKEGKVYINGEQLEEDYLPEGTVTQGGYYNNIRVPQGYVYVMGDNRAESVDSRKFGCIPLEKVEGKVVLRYWPLSEFGGV